MEYSSIFPVTVIAAIGLFVLKEIVEGGRRYRATERRRRGIRQLLARECELNHYAIKSMREVVAKIEDAVTRKPAPELSLVYQKSGGVFFKLKQGPGYSGQPIPRVHNDILGKNLLEIATLDDKLYTVAESAHTAVADLEHVRNSLIYFIDPEDPEDKNLRDGFTDYASRELLHLYEDIAALYRACTDKKLEDFRLR